MTRRALGLVADLIFRSRIDAVARATGAEVVYVSTLEGALQQCSPGPPAVVFVDLSAFPAHNTAVRMRAAAPEARLIGFASHVDLKALRSAQQAGFDLTLSREEFTSRLPELLASGPASP
jgi:DNA-binding NarL/FixJ family response regulator